LKQSKLKIKELAFLFWVLLMFLLLIFKAELLRVSAANPLSYNIKKPRLRVFFYLHYFQSGAFEDQRS